VARSEERPETPDEAIPQDPGIPGRSEVPGEDAPLPDEKDVAAEAQEALDAPDREGHMGSSD
jgi:hypothetical protein